MPNTPNKTKYTTEPKTIVLKLVVMQGSYYVHGRCVGGREAVFGWGADISVFTCMHAYCNWPTCGYVMYTNLLSVPVQVATAPMY